MQGTSCLCVAPVDNAGRLGRMHVLCTEAILILVCTMGGVPEGLKAVHMPQVLHATQHNCVLLPSLRVCVCVHTKPRRQCVPLADAA